VSEAIGSGADIVLPQELFQGPYFCQTEHQDWFAWACTVDEDPGVAAIAKLTRGRGTVVPVSFFERAGQAHYNSVAIVDDGNVLGVYRKSHIPDGPGYEEKFYFNPGDSGFRPGRRGSGTIGVGICWISGSPSQRAMALLGGDHPLPTDRQRDRRPVRQRHLDMWRRAMDGPRSATTHRARCREPPASRASSRSTAHRSSSTTRSTARRSRPHAR
jgi:N-carbamoylputrescine amidase